MLTIGCQLVINNIIKYYESTSKGYVLIKENWGGIEGVTHWMVLPKNKNSSTPHISTRSTILLTFAF